MEGFPHDLICPTWPRCTPRSPSLQTSQCHPYRSFSQALKSSSVLCALLTATAWNCAIMASLCLSEWVCVRLSPSASHAGGSDCFWALRGQAWSALPSANGLFCDVTCCLGCCMMLLFELVLGGAGVMLLEVVADVWCGCQSLMFAWMGYLRDGHRPSCSTRCCCGCFGLCCDTVEWCFLSVCTCIIFICTAQDERSGKLMAAALYAKINLTKSCLGHITPQFFFFFKCLTV